uniref:MFS domain-containing protein n=1 Tax=Parastrongyloides trichosuri TaxID=131310 RepID=A0A0N4ZCZ1_PARTI
MKIGDISKDIEISEDDFALLITIQFTAIIFGKFFMSTIVDFTLPNRFLSISLLIVSCGLIVLTQISTFLSLSVVIFIISFVQSGGWGIISKLCKIHFLESFVPVLLGYLLNAGSISGIFYAFDNSEIWKDRCYVATCVGVVLSLISFIIFSYKSIPKDDGKKKIVEDKGFKEIYTNQDILNVALGYFFVLQCRSLAETRGQKYLLQFPEIDVKKANLYYDIGGFFGGAISGLIASSSEFNFYTEASIIITLVGTGAFFMDTPPFIPLFGVIGFFIIASMNFMENTCVRKVPFKSMGKCTAFVSTIANCGSMTVGLPFEYFIKYSSYKIIPQIFIIETIFYISYKMVQINNKYYKKSTKNDEKVENETEEEIKDDKTIKKEINKRIIQSRVIKRNKKS